MLVEAMDSLVVEGSTLPHLPKDFKPPLPQAAQGAGVAFAFFPLGLIVGLSPGAKSPAAIGPKVNRVAQMAVTMPPDPGLAHLPTGKTHRGCARNTLQRLGFRIPISIVANLRQQSRS